MTSSNWVRSVLWGLWCDALGRPADGRVLGDENFLDAGGDSVRAMMLHAAIEDSLGQQIELADVLDIVAGADFDALATLVGTPPSRDGSASRDHADR